MSDFWIGILIGELSMAFIALVYVYFRTKKVKRNGIGAAVGQLLVDTEDRSTYASFIVDPATLKTGDWIRMQVLIVAPRSQQNQGR